MAAPPRVFAHLGAGRLVFTAGARTGKWFGYRSYDTFGLVLGEQVVVLHNADDGRVAAIAVGNELGPRRTGATGGVAVCSVGLAGTEVYLLAALASSS